MSNRAKKLEGSNSSDLVSVQDLKDLLNENDYKCAVTGHRLYFNTTPLKMPYWSLSYNHIDPLNDTKDKAISWSKSNL